MKKEEKVGGNSRILLDIIEYQPQVTASKIVDRNTVGDITVSSIVTGNAIEERWCEFDTYIQVIEGVADLYINKHKYQLRNGEGILIPAEAKHYFQSSTSFKMIATVVKCQFENAVAAAHVWSTT